MASELVAPAANPSELGYRHQFDVRDAKSRKMVQLPNDRPKGSGRSERPDMELID